MLANRIRMLLYFSSFFILLEMRSMLFCSFSTIASRCHIELVDLIDEGQNFSFRELSC